MRSISTETNPKFKRNLSHQKMYLERYNLFHSYDITLCHSVGIIYCNFANYLIDVYTYVTKNTTPKFQHIITVKYTNISLFITHNLRRCILLL